MTDFITKASAFLAGTLVFFIFYPHIHLLIEALMYGSMEAAIAAPNHWIQDEVLRANLWVVTTLDNWINGTQH